jgi:hypothetical protein
VIEPLTRPRPPVVTPTAELPVLDEIRFNGGWRPGRIAAGLLVGAHYRCPDTGRSYVEIEGFIAGTHCEDVREFGRYLRQQWRSAGATLRYHFPEAEVVGWYVSWTGDEPAWDAEALVLHNTFFTHPWQVALLVPADDGAPRALRAEGDGWRPGVAALVRPDAR